MTEEKKNNMKSWVSIWLTPSLVLGSLLYGAWFVSGYRAESDQRMFKTPEQRIITRDHINSDYNEVKNYQLMQDQKQMKMELDTAYAFVNALFKEDRARIKLDSLNSANAIRSRAKRDSINVKNRDDIEAIQREQTISSNTIQLILQEVRDIKNDTLNN